MDDPSMWQTDKKKYLLCHTDDVHDCVCMCMRVCVCVCARARVCVCVCVCVTGFFVMQQLTNQMY